MTTLISADAVITARGTVGDAVLVDGGRVVAVGTRADLARPHQIEERYTGAYITPGFRDAHLHAAPYASLLAGCSLKSARSIADLLDRLADHASSIPAGAPVIATRFDDEHLAERRLPTRDDLDRAVPDRPAVIYRYCGHVAVANSAALEASGVSPETRDPEGGSIDRGDMGVPNGILRETASGLIAPALSRGGALDDDQLVSALERLASLGITSIGTMIGYGERPSEKLEAEVELWSRVGRRLPIRVHGIVITDRPDQLRWAAETLSGAGPRMRWLGVKRFADGSLGGHTAAMRESFADADTLGTYRLTDADVAIARSALDLGGIVAIHAIGDRAVGGVLDVYRRLIDEGASPESLRVEHVSLIDPEQVRRFAELGVTACVQPAFIASESDWVAGRVGAAREGWIYPFRSMRDAGIPLAGSSDCPVEPPQPLWGMAAAVDRYGVSPAEALEPWEALHLFTDGAARALREPIPIAVGSPADLTIVDTDLTRADASAIRGATVLDTYVDGESVAVDRAVPAWVD